MPALRHPTARIAGLAASRDALGLAACGENDVERGVEEGAWDAEEAGHDAGRAGEDAARDAEKGAEDAQRELEK
jgi:hypothetical protein